MIKNQTIIQKIQDKTKNDLAMQDFLLNIVNHQNESSQFTKEYNKLIDKAVAKRRGVN